MPTTVGKLFLHGIDLSRLTNSTLHHTLAEINETVFT